MLPLIALYALPQSLVPRCDGADDSADDGADQGADDGADNSTDHGAGHGAACASTLIVRCQVVS